MSADPYADVWSADQDVAAWVAGLRREEEPEPFPAPALRPVPDRPTFTPRRQRGQHWEHPLPPRMAPTAQGVLQRTAHGLRHLDDSPPAQAPAPQGSVPPVQRGEEPFYAATRDAHYGTGPQPVTEVLTVPEDGQIRSLLSRAMGALADRTEPIFASSCPDCTPTRPCHHHAAMQTESAWLRRLALALADSDTDRAALRLIVEAAGGAQ